MPRIAACCCTYLRPRHLGAMVDCFQKQTYPDRRLVVLDDAGQYAPQSGDRWELHSTDQRYPSLGAKRNAVIDIALRDPEVEYIAIADDDDFYFPHWLEAIAESLRTNVWSLPNLVYKKDGDRLVMWQAGWDHGGGLQAAMGMRASAFREAGGYDNSLSWWEDGDLVKRLAKVGGRPGDSSPLEDGNPFFVWGNCFDEVDPGYRLSKLGKDGYAAVGREAVEKSELVIEPIVALTTYPVADFIKDRALCKS